jgi:DNA end-binding protein Ku
VAFTQEDLRRVDAVTPNTVTVRELVDAASIDTTTIEKSYYLSPEGDGERPFSVLREMLGESLAAVGLHAANRRETLACIVARHDALILHQLRFAHEAVAPSEVPLPASVELSGEERVLAAALAAKLRKQRFEPSEYRDGAQERVMSQIARKLDGKPLLEMPAPSPAMPLVDALRQSVA